MTRNLSRGAGISGAGVLAIAAALLMSTGAGGGAMATFHRPIAALNANQSTNWSGYNQGSLEDGNELYTSITGTWVVPRATAHLKGQQEYSSTWVGIGGGCVNSGCTTTDNTLIQAGTEQDVAPSGKASYSAWWEIIPEPSTPVSLAVTAGNTVRVTITEGTPGQWTIVISNLSTGRNVTVATPYSSTHATAEWIVETPLIIGTGGGFAALPNLTPTHFDNALTDGANPGLVAAEQMQLVDSNSHVIAQPSAPDTNRDGFADCAWRTACATPGS
jgi:hypothetical protein